MLIKNPIDLLPKQTVAWDYLEDSITTHLGYGGGAGGGKTNIGCKFSIFISDTFPGSRGAIGRHELKNLKRTTLASWFEVANELGLIAEKDYKYNQQESVIKFSNGSEILLLDTAFSPKDPMYTRFGGLELSWCWIDESNESPLKSIEILNTRVGRRNKNPLWIENLKSFFGQYDDKDGIILKPLFLETFNPEKGHIYQRFWKPFKKGELPENRKFVRALASDNPNLPTAYIKKILESGKATIERLLYGNFDYDDDPQKIFNYDKLNDLFTNTHVEDGDKYLTCDPSGKGKDSTVIMIWSGLRVIKIFQEKFTLQDELYERIRKYQKEYAIPNSNTIVDYDGLGVGVTDFLKCVGFQGGSAAITTQEQAELNLKADYRNLRSQCYFTLADKTNKNEIAIIIDDEDIKTKLIEELDVIKEINEGKEQKKQIIPKGGQKDDGSVVTIRSLLGRSPDLADALMMRMYFELNKQPEPDIMWL